MAVIKEVNVINARYLNMVPFLIEDERTKLFFIVGAAKTTYDARGFIKNRLINSTTKINPKSLDELYCSERAPTNNPAAIAPLVEDTCIDLLNFLNSWISKISEA